MIPAVPEHPVFAALYDRLVASMERAGLTDMRGRLLAGATGRTLELGAGTGHNLAHYPPQVSELVLSEPDPHMAKRLRARVEEEGGDRRIETIVAPAQELPFDDGSFDTVVATLVLCTVEDQNRALAEARRVLVPGGAFLFLEHVRSHRPGAARWQDRVERPWGLIAGGCHPNRATDEAIAAAGFWIEHLERGTIPRGLPPIRPMIHGVARRPG
jgi:ubiquinone/menaquinone biosynthesis C-methylase UbiE